MNSSHAFSHRFLMAGQAGPHVVEELVTSSFGGGRAGGGVDRFEGLYDLECLLVTGGGRYGGRGRRLRVSPLSG